MNIPTFEEYISSLGRITPHVDPTELTDEAAGLKEAAESLACLENVTFQSLTEWVNVHPRWVPALGLTVGLSQEKLKNSLKNRFDSSGWQTLASKRPGELIRMLDDEFELVALVAKQVKQRYNFGDILVARAGTKVTANRASKSGRSLEDGIEAIARDLGLPYEVRTRFTGRQSRKAPCDLVIPSGDEALIVVAAKAFDSTGSKLGDAVREVEQMAEVRLPRQYIIAVIDGIGWKSRKSDLKSLYDLWASELIDGMYNLASLEQFRDDLYEAAQLRKLL